MIWYEKRFSENWKTGKLTYDKRLLTHVNKYRRRSCPFRKRSMPISRHLENALTINKYFSSLSARLPPVCPGFDSRTRRHMWVEFVVVLLLCSERFFSGYSGFPLSSKTNISKCQIDLAMHGHFWTSSWELLGAPWVNKLHASNHSVSKPETLFPNIDHSYITTLPGWSVILPQNLINYMKRNDRVAPTNK